MTNVYMPYLFTQELTDSFSKEVKQKFSDYNLVFGTNYKTKKTIGLCCFAPSRNRTWVVRIRTGRDNQLH